MVEPDLRELQTIREMVLGALQPGFHLESVDLTVATLVEGQDPAFTVLIKISEDPGAEGFGLGYNITERIREKWSRDDLYIKVEFCENQP
jgi:hypothetical protein